MQRKNNIDQYRGTASVAGSIGDLTTLRHFCDNVKAGLSLNNQKQNKYCVVYGLLNLHHCDAWVSAQG